jgi:parvulin-like peptidyl-prolyl isomerase
MRRAIALAILVAACDKAAPTATATASASASATPTATSTASATSTSTSTSTGSATEAPTSVAAQHVLVAYKGAKNAPKSVTRSKDEAKKRAAEVTTKAKAGGDFAALVKDYSDDAATKERLGSVGKFTRDKMVKPFADAAFALGVDAVSEPVETEFGFHVIKRNQ